MPHSPDSVQPQSLASAKEKAIGTPQQGGVGKVYLVGAGPGDPGLITVRGQQCLEMADIVLYDGLANPLLLDLAPQAECVSVGKHGQSPIWTQDRINERLVELASAGRVVVRLKGGDPAVFARTAEELEVLAGAKIPFEVVPGITAALAAASYVGIPITHRKHASAVAFITGQQQTTEAPQDIDWPSMAKFPGTIVFYMGVTTVSQWTSNLLRAGKAPGTPAAIVRRCTWSDQTVIRCRLDEVKEQLTPASKLRPPVIVIVGEVASLGREFDWFTQRPLHGCGVLVTRPEGQSESLSEQLRQLGAQVYSQPMLEIHPPSDWTSLDAAVAALATVGEVSGITFSSANGVDGFMQRLHEHNRDSRVFANCLIAAVGPATAAALERYGLRADLLPAVEHGFSATGLMQCLGDWVQGGHWIVTTTNHSRGKLSEGLRELGASVLEALTYETRSLKTPSASVAAALSDGRIQYVTITSSAIARAAYDALDEFRYGVAPVSLSSSISAELRQLGWPPIAEALQNSTQSLMQALVAAAQSTDAS